MSGQVPKLRLKYQKLRVQKLISWSVNFLYNKVLHDVAGIFLFFILFLCKFQVISQAEQEQAELEVKTTKHEIFKVTLSLHTQLNNTELKPVTELGNEHCDYNYSSTCDNLDFTRM